MKTDRIEEMLRATGGREIEPGTGRVAMRVKGRMGNEAPIAQSSNRWHERWTGLASLATAGVIVVAVWVVVGQRAVPGPTSNAIVRMSAAIDRSAAKVRAARPERPMVVEAKRLEAEVKRGVGFVKAVIPRVKFNG